MALLFFGFEGLCLLCFGLASELSSPLSVCFPCFFASFSERKKSQGEEEEFTDVKIKTWKQESRGRRLFMSQRRGRIDIMYEDQKIVPCFCFVDSGLNLRFGDRASIFSCLV
jgi:hypothetical protein